MGESSVSLTCAVDLPLTVLLRLKFSLSSSRELLYLLGMSRMPMMTVSAVSGINVWLMFVREAFRMLSMMESTMGLWSMKW